ncbi:hypothetical protein [Imtechella halotolerans]|uniref:Uncharacterized protein n=1 Tax=Imtechella halotolerans K1 TaxID=946077 RepID=I0W7H2_9FLAO|nr:hypothetical protein [Imtechella halotolerans]EID72338.1 hypothetical protein W5A_12561 [Imtechella halotolerans K1]WMQ64440.1 hypothetical protein PT603_05525 [Imtechella halotolerans]
MQSFIIWITFTLLTTYWTNPKELESNNVTSNIDFKEQKNVPNKTIKFLWREEKYDEQLKGNFNLITINTEYCKTITGPEKAALAYVATFIGNECSWDGKATTDRTNLKCKIPTALQLGYQCSIEHLGFLRKWFRHDKRTLKELESCPTIPDGATVQNTFDEITLSVKENQIIVSFKANGVNIREGKRWRWSQSDYFEFSKNKIRWLKKEKSPLTYETFKISAN